MALLAALLLLGAGGSDHLIVPGVRAGALRPDTRPEQVQGLLGLKPEEFAEGTSGDAPDEEPSTELYSLDSPRRILLLWSRKHPDRLMRVALHGSRSVWKTPEGISLGTTLGSLVKLNGGPFKFYAFEGERSGQVTDWLGGRLKGYQNTLVLTLSLRVPGYNRLSGADKEALEKPADLLSSQPTVKVLDPAVDTLEARLNSTD